MDKISFSPNEVAAVYLNADSVYTDRVLYLYDANGGKTDSVIADIAPQNVNSSNSTPWIDGFGYSVSFTYSIPGILKSGIYSWEKKVFFIVKSISKSADITIIYPSNTEAAYNDAGGKSLYEFNSSNSERAYAVSFLRPQTKASMDAVKVFSDGLVKWLSALSGYSIQYISDMDMDNFSEIENSKIIVIAGHSEYWTRIARLNFDQFVNGGRDAIVLSGNTMWWQVRYSNDKNQLICYKNTLTDPIGNTLLKTITWPSASLHYPVLNSIGLDWPNGAIPQSNYHGWYGYKVLQPDSPLLIGTELGFHDTISCMSTEYDGALLSAFNSNGDPVVDSISLGFCKTELIAYDWGLNTIDNSNKKGYGAFVVFKKQPTSGVVINTGSNGWCSARQLNGMTGGFGGPDSSLIQKITLNMFDLLLSRENVFATPVVTGCVSPIECQDATKDQFEILPNPSEGIYTVQSLEFGMEGIEVFNVLGQKVLSMPSLETFFSVPVDLSFCGNGIYFLRINTTCGMVAQKVLLNH